MNLLVTPDGWAQWGEKRLRCVLGRGGVRPNKREGDGATPVGAFTMRRLLFRPDRLSAPDTMLNLTPISETDGWCDDPADASYNRPVTLPYKARTEQLWRADEIYDLIVPLGYNDGPIVPGLGSAIFLHIARPDFSPTEGCVALTHDDLIAVLADADGRSRVVISA